MHSRIIKLRKLNNLRDLGGIRTEDGREIKRGRLLRCGKLYGLPKSSVAGLKALGVTTVVDFRITAEYNARPDTVIDGVNYVSLPILCTPAERIECERNMRLTMKKESLRLKDEIPDMDEYMIQTYRSIVFNDQPQQSLKRFLRIAAENDGCILWHCSSGKDRTGIGSMLIEGLLGVGEADILEDYVLSRKMLRKKFFTNKTGIALLPASLRFKRMVIGYMRVKSEYLKTVMDEMGARYGGIAGYCKTVLDITDEDIALMKQKYLE